MSIDAIGQAQDSRISAPSPSRSTSSEASDAGAQVGKTGMDYNSFLKLLVAEMSNQDPMKPTDSTEYVAQFATFSNVEQSIQSNKKLDALMSAVSLSAAGSLVGRTATSVDGETSGKIASVLMGEGGMVATLEDGTALALGPGTILE